MATTRAIKCDCGTLLKEQTTSIDGVETQALMCPKCGFTTLTKDQAKNFVKLKQLHTIIDAERRIIKIGNSMGITLPDHLKEYGAEVGKTVKTRAVSPTSFLIEINN